MEPSTERLHRTWIHSDRYIPRRFIRPVQRFFRVEAASGMVMLVAAVLAVVWANSPLHEGYTGLWETTLRLEVGDFRLEESLGHLVNDGLMVLFFFVVGLEVKRELVLGELRDPRSASLPVMAAVGGMLLPALVYLVVAGDLGPAASRGWGVPVATDIAFSVGVLSLLGRRVPTGAKLFLLALAIADDLGGIVVIALFYTDELRTGWLSAAVAASALIWLAARAGVRSHVFYLPAAATLWYFFLESGVHATLAGVVLAFLTPARPMYGVEELDRKARSILDSYPASADTAEQRERADFEAMTLSEISKEAVAPLARNEHRLQVWSSFFVIPLFALANAGVRFDAGLLEPLRSRVAIGVALGLVAGKTIGITLFTWLAVRLGLGRLPRETSWGQLVGVAATAGIGFTVALFITALAFTDPVLADQAKVGIFAGSLVAGVLGTSILLRVGRRDEPPEEPGGEEMPARAGKVSG